MDKVWKKVIDFDSYEVSNEGDIRNAITGKIRKAYVGKRGYLQLCMVSNDGKSITKRVHCIVARAFLGERPDGFLIDHIDTNKLNNYANNLEYVTSAENSRRAEVHGLVYHHKGESHPSVKLTESNVIEMRDLYENHNWPQSRLAKQFNISKSQVQRIVTYVRWKHIQPIKPLRKAA